jgi:hypothetical protein
VALLAHLLQETVVYSSLFFFLKLLFVQTVGGSILRALMARAGNRGTHMGVDT